MTLPLQLTIADDKRVGLSPANGVFHYQCYRFGEVGASTHAVLSSLVSSLGYRNSYMDPEPLNHIDPFHGPFDLTRLRPSNYEPITRAQAESDLKRELSRAASYGATADALATAGETVARLINAPGQFFRLVWTPDAPLHEFGFVIASEWLEVVRIGVGEVALLVTLFD